MIIEKCRSNIHQCPSIWYVRSANPGCTRLICASPLNLTPDITFRWFNTHLSEMIGDAKFLQAFLDRTSSCVRICRDSQVKSISNGGTKITGFSGSRRENELTIKTPKSAQRIRWPQAKPVWHYQPWLATGNNHRTPSCSIIPAMYCFKADAYLSHNYHLEDLA